MDVSSWLKTWGALFVAVIALALSGYAIWMDNVHYQEVTKPHTKHDEIYDRLARLDDKIERLQQWSNNIPDIEQGISELQLNLRKAIELRDQAELAWDEGHYTEADKLISEAHHTLAEIPLLAPGLNWWLVGAIIIGVLIISTIILVVGKRG